MKLTKENLQNLRQDYRVSSLSESDVEVDPILQFKKWFSDAVSAQLYEPNVMTFATADSDGKPSARIVLLKGFDEHGFVFYTNYESKKSQDLIENPQAALVFFWAELERQVRVEGIVSKVDKEVSKAYFHSRPIGSQIGAIASPQSAVITDRSILENKVSALTEQYEGKEIPLPDNWGGYLVEPKHIEFWQGRSSRLHDRIIYDFVESAWKINRLAP
ncbi:pyridoxamine 5'-phosphate oxidase [Pedobacter sp. JCM 36344]|uniref:pyridoxamine 5'-phosphate oxidase n=1 Tax=Pedobacter sp. JCM 36344 TaxID=3374280 RepID=UPI00397DF04B